MLLVESRLALTNGATVADLRSVVAGVPVLLAGMETHPAYQTAARDAVAFVSLDGPPEHLLAAIKQAVRSPQRQAA